MLHRGGARSHVLFALLLGVLTAGCAAQPDAPGVSAGQDAQKADAPGPVTDAIAGEEDVTVDVPKPKPGAERTACDPCEHSDQCVDPGSVCAGMGKPFGAAGFFCQLPCDKESPCPEGSVCDGTSTVEGEFVSACRPLSNFCGCSTKARDNKWTTPCFHAGFDNGGQRFGKCAGQWRCDEQGARCDAEKPTQELCDGVDSDCDGQTDEGADCDDGDACTTGESCEAGKCTPGTDQCACRADSDCDVADRCSESPVCDKSSQPWSCSAAPISVVCDPAKNTACEVNACSPKTGLCGLIAGIEGAGCDADNDACTESDFCQAGACKPGPAKPCDDTNPCTFDSCKVVGAAPTCSHANQTGTCDDGNACTATGTCVGGLCAPGAATVCDDNDPCTADDCDPATGVCGSKPAAANVSCDDGDACTSGETCGSGKCADGTAASCDDGNPCTTDTCSPQKGCSYTPAVTTCDDGNDCTTKDTCDKGACVGGPNICACEKNSDCAAKQAANPCLGSLVCNTTVTPHGCVAVQGTAIACQQDSNPCSQHACDAKTGKCTAKPAADKTICDDGDPCTAGDLCKAGACLGPIPLGCDDNNACTVDACSKNAANPGCSHVPKGGGCDDGNACTSNDACTNGQCVAGASKVCNDDNGCTTDACDPQNGSCAHDPKGSDGLVCKSGVGACGPAVCKGGQCAALSKAPCGDGNPCSDDMCKLGAGCQHTFNSDSCDDGNVCTAKDTCAKGSCKPGPPRSCDDANTCTLDKCDPSTLVNSGCVHTPNKAATCDDGDLCTSGDHCEGANCAATPKDCGDDEECTLDTCSKGVCSHDKTTKNGKSCRVHKWCWGKGTCGAGVCVDKPGTCPVKKWQQMWPIQFETKLREATTLFDPVGVHVVRVTVAEDAWAAYLQQVLTNKKGKTYRKADIEFDGEVFKGIGIRPFGYGSQFYNPSKPNIRMNFDYYDDDAVGPYKRRNIRLKASGQDRTFLRQPLSQSLVQQAGGHAPRWSWARVFVNGEPFGLYQLFEHVDKRFFNANFGNTSGNDYEPSPICRGFNCPSKGCNTLDNYYTKDPGDGGELNKLAEIVANSPDATWAAEVGKIVDWQPLLAQYAVEAVLSDFDSLAAAGNNYEVYVNKSNGLMQFIPGGMDLNFGRSNGWYELYTPWGKPNTWCKGRTDHLYLRIVKTPKMRAALDASIKSLHCGAFSKANQLEFVDKMRAMLAVDLYNDPKGVASGAVIDKWFTNLKAYITKRDAYLDTKIGKCL